MPSPSKVKPCPICTWKPTNCTNCGYDFTVKPHDEIKLQSTSSNQPASIPEHANCQPVDQGQGKQPEWECRHCEEKANSADRTVCKRCRKDPNNTGAQTSIVQGMGTLQVTSAPKMKDCPICTFQQGALVEMCELCGFQFPPPPDNQSIARIISPQPTASPQSKGVMAQGNRRQKIFWKCRHCEWKNEYSVSNPFCSSKECGKNVHTGLKRGVDQGIPFPWKCMFCGKPSVMEDRLCRACQKSNKLICLEDVNEE